MNRTTRLINRLRFRKTMTRDRLAPYQNAVSPLWQQQGNRTERETTEAPSRPRSRTDATHPPR